MSSPYLPNQKVFATPSQTKGQRTIKQLLTMSFDEGTSHYTKVAYIATSQDKGDSNNDVQAFNKLMPHHPLIDGQISYRHPMVSKMGKATTELVDCPLDLDHTLMGSSMKGMRICLLVSRLFCL